MTNTETIRVYVGTYAKYNNGSIAGAWLDLSDYVDKDEFLAACAELHTDEADPELMFQDWEGGPEGMVSESYVDEAAWEWLAMSDDDRELLAAYRDGIDSKGTLEQAQECFEGVYDSLTDWAEQYAESTGMLDSMPENLRCYFDFERFARDCRLNGDISEVEYEGKTYVFNRH